MLRVWPSKDKKTKKKKKDTYTPMFIAALFTIAKTWKQLKCPATDDGLKRCGIYTQWYTTQPLKERNNAI